MKKMTYLTCLICFGLSAQEKESSKLDKFTFGGYGDIEYLQPLDGNINGKADIHRAVFYIGYEFNDRLTLNSEIEIEHIKEIYVEQLYFNYHLNSKINLRGGLMLVPMGIINETHESITFNGVTRPNVDKYIVPSTWRELGLGVYGNIYSQNLKYQIYLFNGLLSHDGDKALLEGSSGIRLGRQKASEASFNSPNLSVKVEWEGVKGLNLGLAAYYGKASTGEKDPEAEARDKAEVAEITVRMLGLDARYKVGNLQMRGEVIYAQLKGARDYNKTYGRKLGNSMFGWFTEVGYDILPMLKGTLKGTEGNQLIVFSRYEHYSPQNTVEDGFYVPSYSKQDWVTGLNYIMNKHVALKVDYVQRRRRSVADPENIFQLGLGYTF